jgi:hypothetical protein
MKIDGVTYQDVKIVWKNDYELNNKQNKKYI